jgi:TorA maturation chaperone TorD
MGNIATSFLSSEEVAARSGTYRLLARLWLREVDRDLVRELRSPPLCDSFVAAGGILPAGDDEPTIEQLAIAYCRLFAGPADHLPPFQSVWKTDQFQGTATASMKNFIEVVGYDTKQLPSGMMLDHLGVQLDVMRHILAQVSTWQSDTESLGQVLELADSFFARHLLWPAELLEAAMRRAPSGFYRSLVVLTREFLKSERPDHAPQNRANPDCST